MSDAVSTRTRGAVALWVFGYGSLVWRPAFPHVRKEVGFIRGWTRRFWQASTDHRGVPGAPGRVVTLVPEPEARCWGVAYGVHDQHVDAVIRGLDLREQGGYAQHRVEVQLGDGGLLREALIYVATPDNPSYAGPAPLPAIAAQVRSAHGPSGSNVEYVLRLADALRQMSAADEHVFALEALLRDAPGGGPERVS